MEAQTDRQTRAARENHRSPRGGFTLIELILVIAILVIISSLAISKFTDLKIRSAERVNISTMQNVQRTAETYITAAYQKSGLFSHLDSLLEYGPGGSWYGLPGQYDFSEAKNDPEASPPGIYRGLKGVTPQKREENLGLTKSLAESLGIYYLKSREVETLKDYGISDYLLHNYKSDRGCELGFKHGDGNMPIVNGGPGFRVNYTAFYPSILTNGSPVAVINPASSNGRNIFKALGYDPKFDADTLQEIKEASDAGAMGQKLYKDRKVSVRLICFGVGGESAFAQKALDTVPRSQVLGREYYSQYILVFKQETMGWAGYKVAFAGVIDPQGNCIDDARFAADWR